MPAFTKKSPPSNYRTWGGLTGISLRAAVQARMVLALAEGPGLVCTGVGPWVVTCPPLEEFLRKVIDPSFILLCMRAARSKSWRNVWKSPSTIASLMGPCRLLITICTASSSFMFHFALAAKFLHRLTLVMNSKPGCIFSFTRSQRLGDVPPGATTGWWICQSHRKNYVEHQGGEMSST